MPMNFYGLLESVFTITIFIVIGFLLAKLGIIKKSDTSTFSNLIFYVTSPALIIYNVTAHFTRELLLSSLLIPLFAMLMTIISLIAGTLVWKMLKYDDPLQKDVFLLTVSFCNTVFIGLPIITSAYGESISGFVFFYDLGSGIMLWTLGVNLASKGTTLGEYEISGSTFKNLINPPVMALILAVLMVVLGIQLPVAFYKTFKTLGDVTIPLSLLFIGISISRSLENEKIFDIKLMLASLIRLIVSPLLLGTILYFVPFPIIFKKVITVEAAMPSMTFTAILAARYGKSPLFAAKTIFVTTLFSMLTVQVVVYLLELVY